MEEIEIWLAEPEDAGELLAIYAPYVEETAITFEYTVPSLAEFQERIRHTRERYSVPGGGLGRKNRRICLCRPL